MYGIFISKILKINSPETSSVVLGLRTHLKLLS